MVKSQVPDLNGTPAELRIWSGSLAVSTVKGPSSIHSRWMGNDKSCNTYLVPDGGIFACSPAVKEEGEGRLIRVGNTAWWMS